MAEVCEGAPVFLVAWYGHRLLNSTDWAAYAAATTQEPKGSLSCIHGAAEPTCGALFTMKGQCTHAAATKQGPKQGSLGAAEPTCGAYDYCVLFNVEGLLHVTGALVVSTQFWTIFLTTLVFCTRAVTC